ncbi:jmjC domain-containing protein 8-like, partial [Scleropages formosus]
PSGALLHDLQQCRAALDTPPVTVEEQRDTADGGWSSGSGFRSSDEGPCTVDIWDTSLTYAQFLREYAYSKPVILRGCSDNKVRPRLLFRHQILSESTWMRIAVFGARDLIRSPACRQEFRHLCSKQRLLQEYGERLVRLSTANTYSYRKVDIPFQEYVEHLLKPQAASALGSDTLYFFGDNNFTEWHSLFKKYSAPCYILPRTTGAYSFGIAGPGTGVPFHWHGPGYSEVIYGRKRWFLYPPDKKPHFHPNRTTLSWVTDAYPTLPAEDKPIECTIRPGEVLYFPDRWWHATLNLDTSVFISTFLG